MAENSSRINDNNYFVVNGWMINRLRLKGVSLCAYAIIYGFTQDGENEFTGSLQYLCDFCGGVSKPTIIKALKELTESGLIIRREEYINNILFTRYRINPDAVNMFFGGSKKTLPVVKNFNGGSKEILLGSKETLPDGSQNSLIGSKDSLPNNKDINNIDNKDIDKEDIDKEDIDNVKDISVPDIDIKKRETNKREKNFASEVIEYLNAKAGTKYRVSSKVTMQHIHARIAEGFTLQDFRDVIDKKCAEWLGTEFEQYLRPATLFATKFESYLNAPVSTRKKYGQSGIAIAKPENDDLADIF